METNENSCNIKMATDGPVEVQAPFSNAEVMDTTPVENAVPLNNEEPVKKIVEPETVEVVEHMNEDIVENEHVVNNKEEMICDEPVPSDSVKESPSKPQSDPVAVPVTESPSKAPSEPVTESPSKLPSDSTTDSPSKPQSDSTTESPSKSQMHNSEADPPQDTETVDCVTTSKEVKEDTDYEPPEEVQPDQSEEMEEDNSEETVKEPPEPDSTPAPVTDELSNDAQHSEDETKVEEVSSETQHDKIEESTAEPVVEEPQEVEVKLKEEDDEQIMDDTKPEEESKQLVEISDVTNKEDDAPEALFYDKVQEEKKTDEDLLMVHINTAYQCLDDFMKTKDEIKIKDCMDLLTEIKTLTNKTVVSLKLLTAEQKDKGHGSKKGKRSKSSGKPSKSTPRGSAKNEVDNESDSPDPFEEVNLKDIKGLAVFAKWPNSGWFYPGVVRDLALADLKSGNQNLTVTFYDGLERDMKSINIFPAELIPASSILFDLDEETDLTVSTIEREENWVKFVLTTADGTSEPVTKDFDKMAIKGVHMKTIKQTVDSQSVAANKSENIVTGRRARGKSSMFNEDYVSSSSPRSTEKRKAKVDDSKSTPAKAPAKRKSSSKDDESGDSTPSRSASKRRQVNGTKSTPRRAAKK